MYRRSFLAAAAAVGLGACSRSAAGGQASANATAPATLRLVWWGSEDRQRKTKAAAELFMTKHPNIRVNVEPVAYDGYFDKLATQFAAGDAPDVMQLAIELVRDYVGRKALLPFTSVATDKLDPSTTQQGQFDGKQYVVAAGLATTSTVVNTTMFAKAGVPLPNDSTWTWADYQRIAAQITTALGAGFYGSGPILNDWNLFGAFIRQQSPDAQLFDAAGTKIGFTAEMAQRFFEYLKSINDAKGTPPPAEQFEDISKGVEQTGVGQNKYAMGFLPSSQYQALRKASGQDIVPLRLPSNDGTAKGAKMAIGASQMWSIYARTKFPAQAQMLVDFLVNDKEAGDLLLVSRGSAPNADVRNAIKPKLDPSEARIADFLTEITPETVGNPLPPAGTSNVQDILRRKVSDYLFGRSSAEAAAKSLIDEITGQIKA